MPAHFTVTDALVVLVILVSMAYATIRGFMWEALTLIAWIGAVLCCIYFGPAIVPLVQRVVPAPRLSQLIAYAAIFLLVLIPLMLASNRIANKMKSSPVRPFDRALGAVFGGVRGLVIVGMAHIAFTWFVPVQQQPAWLSEAETLPLIQASDEVLLSLLPQQDQPDYTLAPAPGEFVHGDILGDLTRCGPPLGHRSCYRKGAVMKAPGALEK